MHQEVIIQVEKLGKKYSLGQSRSSGGARYTSLRDVLAEKFRMPLRRSRNGAATKPLPEEFWALRDVDFEVRRGEVVGIIGRNGAGKSTLLKILSRITEPTEGKIRLRGRVASLLEVGTGFHAELTGRENIYLNGAILGMHRSEIRAKFDEIVAFAEVEKFLDTPVKRYSSGMYVRLAFAVAAHLEPEILIVDEVLAVGDAEFQKKCLGKMKDVAIGQERTVLFVSHNMAAVSELTSRCLLLNKGAIGFQGSTREAISRHLNTTQRQAKLGFHTDPKGTKPEIVRMELVTSEPFYVHGNNEPLEIVVDVFTPRAVRAACLTLKIVDHQQQAIVQLWTFGANVPFLREAGIATLRCRIPQLRLFMGCYTITTYLAEGGGGGEHFGSLEGLCPFEVIMRSERAEYPWAERDCQYLEEFAWELEGTQSMSVNCS